MDQENRFAPWVMPMVTAFVLGIFVAALLLAWWQNDDNALVLMYGSIISMATTVVGYFFGSSAGSARKSATISRIAANQPGLADGNPSKEPPVP